MLMKYQISINQFKYFLVAGIIAVSIDFSIYILTLDYIGPIFSKLLGFYSGVIISFIINSSLTFKKNRARFNISKYFLKYTILLSVNMVINVLINYLLLNFLASIEYITFLSFSLATSISMLLNFVGMKLLVFKC